MTRHGLGASGLVVVLLLGTVLAATTKATTWYVDDDAPAGGNGQSWPTAFRYLQDALHVCATGDEIRVAAGRYTPDRDEAGLVTPLDRSASFILVEGVALRGGYAGIGSADPDSQDVARYFTVLSGDLRENDVWPDVGSDNSQHVLTAEALSSSTLLDGLVIEGGRGWHTGTNELSRSGGGIFSLGSSLQIQRCTFRHCYAYWYGAALYHGAGGVVSLVNCFFERCQAESGAAVFVDGPSELVMDHCTVVDNLTETAGGGLALRGATAAVTNCVFRDNRTEDEYLLPTEAGQVFADEASTLTVDHCCVHAWTGSLGGAGNFDADPLLVRRGFRLTAGSPCIDAGGSGAGWTDMDSEAPGPDGLPDIGADEFVDSDTNGLPDRWEQIHFGAPTGADPASDTDTDELTALEEYALNTNPVVARGVYYVDPAGDDAWDGLAPVSDGAHGPKRTIQAAIDATHAGEIDVVVVRDGIYTGAGNRGLRLPAHDMVLRSENGPVNCIVDCEKAERGIRVDRRQTSATEIRGLTIRRGKAMPSSWAAARGGGLYCDHTDATIRDCVVYECEAVEGSTAYGGGIYLNGSRGRLCDCFLAGCLAEGDHSGGGGLALWGGAPQVERCLVLENQAHATDSGVSGLSAGGGITSWVSQSSIRDCLVAGNTAFFGGGVCDVTSSDLVRGSRIERCELRQNVATLGGGFYCERAASDLITCVIVRNLSESTAAVHSYDSAHQWPFVTNCLIAENSNVNLSDMATPLLAGLSGVYFVSNSIVWGNDPLQAGDYVEMDYSSVQGGYAGTGNIDAMPAFPLGQDWHLLPGSPGVDGGTNSPSRPLPLYDFDGVLRAVDGDGSGDARPDVGPYEYVPGVPRLAVSPSWIDIDVPRGGPETEPVQLSIRNCGDGVLHWQASEDAPWLSLSTVEGESAGQTQTVEITFDTAGLTWGRYIAFVTLSSDGIASAERRIPITLHVRRVRRFPAHYSTIQAAINTAERDDVIMIADGVYSGAGFSNLELQNKRIMLGSENGPANCIIDCGYSGPGITIEGCGPMPTLIQGLTIQHASQSGVKITDSEGVVLRNCRLLDNQGSWGGGLTISDHSRVDLEGCLLQNNVASGIGGGAYARQSVLTMRDCQVCDNQSGSHTNRGGGGIATEFAHTSIHRCQVTGNSTDGAGGGVDLWDARTARISHCLIAGNLASAAGGISIYGTFLDEEVLIQNTVIASNTATNGYGGGVGVNDGALRLQNSTVVGNTATAPGGGLLVRYDALLNLRNSIVTENTATQGPQIALMSGGSLDARRSAVRGGRVDIWRESGAGGIGWGYVVEDDPLLKDPAGPDQQLFTWHDGDYTLRAGSPCIDSASSASLPIDWLDADADQSWVEWLPVDAAGLSRVVDDPIAPNVGYGEPAFVDMGAFEYQDDCNGNGVVDSVDLADGTSEDCTDNGIPDECELDCDGNGLADVCEINLDPGLDLNGNGHLDVCEPVHYVNASANGTGTGWTWDDAYTDLQDALAAATPGSEIWVAAGTYRPDRKTNDPMATFVLKDGVTVYGGFAGGEASLEERDLAANPTILSGDYGTENSYHVVHAQGVRQTAVLDGFVITGGRADGPGGTHDVGAGARIVDSTIELRNCVIRGNTANGHGGGIVNGTGSILTLVNCVISGNTAGIRGGGIQNYQSTLTATNCTIVNNASGTEGGGGFCNESNLKLTNCIFWGNTASGGASTDQDAQIYRRTGELEINHSCVYSWTGSLGGVGNNGLDPRFVDADGLDNIPGTVDDDLRLSLGSGSIDSGDNTADTNAAADGHQPLPLEDAAGGPRFLDDPSTQDTGVGDPPIVDRGAYEFLFRPRLYVRYDAPAAGTGWTWDDAYTDLQDALAAATPGSEIWVAAGTYRPDRESSDPMATFALKDGVTVYGGFAGGELSLEERDLAANPTILSGDYGTENSYHVVHAQDVHQTAVLDGFVITGGRADRPAGTHSVGAGARIVDSTIELRNCVIRGNTADGNGGGIVNSAGSILTLVNCVISGNTAGIRGGGIQNYRSTLTATNCTIVNNASGAEGGGSFCNESNLTLTNCIFWGNTEFDGLTGESAQIHAIASGLALNHSCVDGLTGDLDGVGNTGADPRMVDAAGPDNVAGTTDDNPRLLPTSPCIDTGSNEAVTVQTDLDGHPRIYDGGSGEVVVDMGAFEYQEDCNGNGVVDSLDLANGTSADCNGNGMPDECEVLYVNAAAGGAGTGRSWANAVTDLQEALSLADTSPTLVSQIWVARGTYQPDSGTGDRTRSFVLRDGLALYGGFAGRETRLTQRRLQSNPTILSADLGQQVFAYHVVDGSGVGPTAVLDGFVIERGYADGPTEENAHRGGGILITDGSPTIRHCVIRNNRALVNGGGVSIIGNSAPTFKSCVFISNAAGNNGGAIQAYQCGLTLTNCTVAGNRAGAAGAGIFLNGVEGLITNCISWGNDIGQDYGESSQLHVINGTPSLDYNCVQNWSETLPGAGVGNIGADPLFIAQPTTQTSGDARLRFGSAAINAGDPTFTPAPGEIDAAGDLRVRCGRIDIGAYEYGQHDPDCDGNIELEEQIEAAPIPTAAPVRQAASFTARQEDPSRLAQ
ncbi:MAG: hypothetical protein JXB13_03810 [Phycisphaerae bacterium]|nr:hypothetical protein [Phycisphaerae bacterium]